MRYRTIPCLLTTALTLSSVAACGSSGPGGGDVHDSGRPTVPAAPPRQAYDPPTAFDAGKGVVLPGAALGMAKEPALGRPRRSLPVVLDGTTAYLATTDSLQAVDVTTGKVTTTLGARNPAAQPSSTSDGDNPAGAPVLATVNGKSDAAVAFLENVPGQGTTAGHLSVELAALDTGTGQAAWSMLLDVPDGVIDPRPTSSNSPSATLLGVHGSTAVVEVTDGHQGVVLAADLGTRKALWEKNAFLPLAVAGSQVVGVVHQDGGDDAVTALDLTDGHQVWSLPNDVYNTSIDVVGPTKVLVSAQDFESGAWSAQLVDDATGHAAPVASFDSGTAVSQCLYDDRSVILCANDSTVVAADATDGHQLWSLPDAAHHRVAPKVSALWHGLAYGVTENGPVILDARTGADRSAGPTITPLLVDGYTALAYDGGHSDLRAYPTTG
ncbi:PQQ-binding-like beta-propeller repeat protein [Kitasatospora sp. LaBMicrA B282]|uniref:outer membrane protein assembly factor BamB family protein n=1 Tax=Kitasatospora sp. LaBMicrA B282 TaxID=3420949 RepID=UPI003D0CB919